MTSGCSDGDLAEVDAIESIHVETPAGYLEQNIQGSAMTGSEALSEIEVR